MLPFPGTSTHRNHRTFGVRKTFEGHLHSAGRHGIVSVLPAPRAQLERCSVVERRWDQLQNKGSKSCLGAEERGRGSEADRETSSRDIIPCSPHRKGWRNGEIATHEVEVRELWGGPNTKCKVIQGLQKQGAWAGPNAWAPSQAPALLPHLLQCFHTQEKPHLQPSSAAPQHNLSALQALNSMRARHDASWTLSCVHSSLRSSNATSAQSFCAHLRNLGQDF